MEKQKQEAQIEDETNIIEEIEIRWKNAVKDWKEILTKEKEFREQDILDFYHSDINGSITIEKK